MREATLNIPAEYVEDLRAALVAELAEEATLVAKTRVEAEEKARYDEKAAECARADHLGAIKILYREAEIFRQAGFDGDGPVEIRLDDDQGTLAFACETMARKIVGPRLEDALDTGPIDSEHAEHIRELMARLDWAVSQAAAVNASYFPAVA